MPDANESGDAAKVQTDEPLGREPNSLSVKVRLLDMMSCNQLPVRRAGLSPRFEPVTLGLRTRRSSSAPTRAIASDRPRSRNPKAHLFSTQTPSGSSDERHIASLDCAKTPSSASFGRVVRTPSPRLPEWYRSQTMRTPSACRVSCSLASSAPFGQVRDPAERSRHGLRAIFKDRSGQAPRARSLAAGAVASRFAAEFSCQRRPAHEEARELVGRQHLLQLAQPVVAK